MRVFIIGSLSCADRIRSVAEYFSKELGDEVEYVKKQPEKTFETLVEEVFTSISKADRIVAIRKDNGSFGEETIYELMFAKFLGKQVTKLGGECEIG